MTRIESMTFKALLILCLALSFLLSNCNSKDQQITTSSQSMIEFPDDLLLDDSHEIPEYLDPEKILCNGKGLKVGKCISKQLKKGICLGIIRHDKRIYAVEIPCKDIKKDSIHSTITQ